MEYHGDSIRALYAVEKVLRIVPHSQAMRVTENPCQGAGRTAKMCIDGRKESMYLYQEEELPKYIREAPLPVQYHKTASHVLWRATFTIPMDMYKA